MINTICYYDKKEKIRATRSTKDILKVGEIILFKNSKFIVKNIHINKENGCQYIDAHWQEYLEI